MSRLQYSRNRIVRFWFRLRGRTDDDFLDWCWKNSGSVIYLPAGDYYLSKGNINLIGKSIQGEGTGRTIIRGREVP